MRPDWADDDGVTTSLMDLARRACGAGDSDRVEALLDDAEQRWRSLQDYSINWVTSLLSYIGEHLGEEAVEDALRRFGDTYLAERRSGGPDWNGLPVEARAKAVARAMVANGADCEVEDDGEVVTLAFRCGTGGRLIDEGAYDGPDGYLTLTGPAPRTLGRDRLPVYCAHCPVNNELQPIEQTGYPLTIEHPPRAAGEPCVHHLYHDPDDIPDEAYERLGKQRP